MSLWHWIKAVPAVSAATPAIPETGGHESGVLSQPSQLSQGVTPAQKRPDDMDSQEAFGERAAIMEFDGGYSRTEAERLAAGAQCPTRLEPVPWRGAHMDLGDLRPCAWCRNFTPSGRCLAAIRGELRAARDWEPVRPDFPLRCIGMPLHLMIQIKGRGGSDGRNLSSGKPGKRRI